MIGGSASMSTSWGLRDLRLPFVITAGFLGFAVFILGLPGRIGRFSEHAFAGPTDQRRAQQGGVSSPSFLACKSIAFICFFIGAQSQSRRDWRRFRRAFQSAGRV